MFSSGSVKPYEKKNAQNSKRRWAKDLLSTKA